MVGGQAVTLWQMKLLIFFVVGAPGFFVLIWSLVVVLPDYLRWRKDSEAKP
jgi:hypothetical protein